MSCFAAVSSMRGLLSLPHRLPPLPAGKPCGNGWPMAGLITSPRLAAAFSAPGMEFFATGGEPDGGSKRAMSCSSGLLDSAGYEGHRYCSHTCFVQ